MGPPQDRKRHSCGIGINPDSGEAGRARLLDRIEATERPGCNDTVRFLWLEVKRRCFIIAIVSPGA
jgi:hypothetical protein